MALALGAELDLDCVALAIHLEETVRYLRAEGLLPELGLAEPASLWFALFEVKADLVDGASVFESHVEGPPGLVAETSTGDGGALAGQPNPGRSR